MSKKWYQSMAILSAIGYQVLGILEQNGVIPPGATQSLVQLAQAALGVSTIWGVRRAIPGGGV